MVQGNSSASPLSSRVSQWCLVYEWLLASFLVSEIEVRGILRHHLDDVTPDLDFLLQFDVSLCTLCYC